MWCNELLQDISWQTIPVLHIMLPSDSHLALVPEAHRWLMFPTGPKTFPGLFGRAPENSCPQAFPADDSLSCPLSLMASFLYIKCCISNSFLAYIKYITSFLLGPSNAVTKSNENGIFPLLLGCPKNCYFPFTLKSNNFIRMSWFFYSDKLSTQWVLSIHSFKWIFLNF